MTTTQTPWWTLDNMLLVHGININGRPKGGYVKLPEKPWPDQGEVNCSIISPLTQAAYASDGLILRPTVPLRFSYKDVGSGLKIGDDPATAERISKGKVWTPQQLGMKELMFLTLAAGTYNEVHVRAQDTPIIGVFGHIEDVQRYIETESEAATWTDPNNPYIGLAKMMCHAMLQAEFYLHKKRNNGNNTARWQMMDKLSACIEAAGYDTKKDIGAFPRLADDITTGKVSIDEFTKNIKQEEIFGGTFLRQPITADMKHYIMEKLGLQPE